MTAALAILKTIWTLATSKVGAMVAWVAVSTLAVSLVIVGGRNATAQRQITALARERDTALTNYGTCQANTVTLQSALASQNVAVAALKAEGDQRTAAAQKAVSDAQKASVRASTSAARVLAQKPGPDACKSADALILGSVS